MKHKITLNFRDLEFRVDNVLSQVCVTGIMKYYYNDIKYRY